ncbi:MAG: hypothetical protein J0L91_05865 [Burkholderiales bacterium]|nr:hypothetical protein [Burkholderiales bacterium]
MARALLAAGLVAITAVHAWCVWLGAGAFVVLAAGRPDLERTWATKLAVQADLPFPFHALAVQSAALISLVVALAALVGAVRRGSDGGALALAATCHVGVLVALLCLVGVGVLSPLVGVVSVLR